MHQDRYMPHPLDLYLYCYPPMLVGAVAIGNGEKWTVLGVLLLLLGLLLGCWIIFSGVVREYISAKEAFASTAKILSKTRDPEVWQALGVTPPQRSEPVMFQSAPTQYKFKEVGWSSPQLTAFANGILRGDPLTEDHWVTVRALVTGKPYRKLHKALKEDKFIIQKNKTNPRLGYVFTRKGMDNFILKYATPELIEGERRDKAPADLPRGSPLLRAG